MRRMFNRKYFIFFTEWIGVNESLSLVFRYSALKATVSLLLRDMSLEDVWKFYRKREMVYRSIRLLAMLFLLLVLYQLYKDFYSYFYQLSPLMVTAYICMLPILKTGHRYSDIWEDKSEFLNLVRSRDIENYKMQKANFWNYKNTYDEERILTIHYQFNFNIVVVQMPQRKRNPEYDRFLRKVEAGRFFHGIPPEEFLDTPNNFELILRSTKDGREFPISLKAFIDRIQTDIEASITAGKKRNDFLDASLDFEQSLKMLRASENNFNQVPMYLVVRYFDFFRRNSSCNIKELKGINLTDEQYVRFINELIVEGNEICLDFILPKGVKKEFVRSVFHKFYTYNLPFANEYDVSYNEKAISNYVRLMSLTFKEFKGDTGANFKSRNYDRYSVLLDDYIKLNGIQY